MKITRFPIVMFLLNGFLKSHFSNLVQVINLEESLDGVLRCSLLISRLSFMKRLISLSQKDLKFLGIIFLSIVSFAEWFTLAFQSFQISLVSLR